MGFFAYICTNIYIYKTRNSERTGCTTRPSTSATDCSVWLPQMLFICVSHFLFYYFNKSAKCTTKLLNYFVISHRKDSMPDMLLKGQPSQIPFCWSVELAEWNMFIIASGFYAAPKSAVDCSLKPIYQNLYIVFHHRVKAMNDMGHI